MHYCSYSFPFFHVLKVVICNLLFNRGTAKLVGENNVRNTMETECTL